MLRLNITGITAEEATAYIVEGLRAKQVALADQIAAVQGEATAPATASRPRATTSTNGSRRQMSPEARLRISQAQHDRWAKVKKDKKRAAQLAGPQPILTAEMDAELAGDIALAAV